MDKKNIADERMVMVNKENLQRALYMLMVANNLLTKQLDSVYVLDMLSETLDYDGCECDGHCVLEDIQNTLDDFRIRLEDMGIYEHSKYTLPEDFRDIEI